MLLLFNIVNKQPRVQPITEDPARKESKSENDI